MMVSTALGVKRAWCAHVSWLSGKAKAQYVFWVTCKGCHAHLEGAGFASGRANAMAVLGLADRPLCCARDTICGAVLAKHSRVLC